MEASAPPTPPTASRRSPGARGSASGLPRLDLDRRRGAWKRGEWNLTVSLESGAGGGAAFGPSLRTPSRRRQASAGAFPPRLPLRPLCSRLCCLRFPPHRGPQPHRLRSPPRQAAPFPASLCLLQPYRSHHLRSRASISPRRALPELSRLPQLPRSPPPRPFATISPLTALPSPRCFPLPPQSTHPRPRALRSPLRALTALPRPQWSSLPPSPRHRCEVSRVAARQEASAGAPLAPPSPPAPRPPCRPSPRRACRAR